MAGQTVLTINDAHKRFGSTEALRGASLELQRGEWLGLLGPNGAGKTTLVRAIAGRVRLSRGAITLLGTDLTTAPNADVRRHLAIVPQDMAIYEKLTARENLQVWAALHGVADADIAPRVDWALQWIGLEARADDRAGTFSGGMKRRLNIGCGVLHEPKIILLDEPTVGVDPQSRHRIWQMLGELREGGATLMLTTHQLDEAQQVCDRIVIIDHGKVIAAGTFDELLEQTVGAKRLVTCHLDGDMPAALAGDQSGDADADGRVVIRQVDDPARDLPVVLREIEDAGGNVSDLRLESPTLQSVFLHLTGRELRE
jgi:ABC-2 type transport system ATP-binding protein